MFTLSIEGRDEDVAAMGDLDITDSLTLTGAGQEQTIIDGGGIDRVLYATLGPNLGYIVIDISDLTVRNGGAQRISGPDPGNGGGILVDLGVDMTLTRVTISDNTAERQGGGIYNEAGFSLLGSLTLIECSIVDNRSGSGTPGGGGIANAGQATLERTLVSGNFTRPYGAYGGISNGGTLTLMDSSVSGNTSGGIGNSGRLIVIRSDVIGNSGGGILAGGKMGSRSRTARFGTTQVGASTSGGILEW